MLSLRTSTANVPGNHQITHSYCKIIGIPGVSRDPRGALVVMRAAITPGREGLLGMVFERPLGAPGIAGRWCDRQEDGSAGGGTGFGPTGFGWAPPYLRSRLA